MACDSVPWLDRQQDVYLRWEVFQAQLRKRGPHPGLGRVDAPMIRDPSHSRVQTCMPHCPEACVGLAGQQRLDGTWVSRRPGWGRVRDSSPFSFPWVVPTPAAPCASRPLPDFILRIRASVAKSEWPAEFVSSPAQKLGGPQAWPFPGTPLVSSALHRMPPPQAG